MKRISILIADDHEVVRSGLSAIFASQKDLSVIGSARNGAEAINLAARLKPDVILMDLVMPDTDGAVATRQIFERNPAARIIILTTFATSFDLRRALNAGAVGAISKDTPNRELIAAIRKVAAGERYVSIDIANQLSVDADLPHLTDRQLDILDSLARGLTNQDIATKLAISEDGVKFHMRTLFAKLNVANRSEAAAFALKHQLIR